MRNIDTYINEDIQYYSFVIKLDNFAAKICFDSKKVYNMMKEEFVYSVSDDKTLQYDLIIYIVRKKNYQFTYLSDYIYVQFKNGIFICNAKICKRAYIFYHDDGESEIFRVGIVKATNISAFRKKIPMLHSSLINLNGIGVSIIGHSGAGKSSLAAGIVLRYGGRFICDDGYYVIRKGNKAYGYGLVPLTGIDMDALSALQIDILDEMKPNMNNVLEGRKRKYVNIENYRTNSSQEFTQISCVLFIIRENSDETWRRKLSYNEAKQLLKTSGLTKITKDDWDDGDLEYFMSLLKDVDFYVVGMAKDYIQNIEQIKQWFVDNKE